MALSRRAKITAGVFGIAASALFAASGSAFAADEADSDASLVIVEPAQQQPSTMHASGDCAKDGSTTSTVADSR